MLCFCYLSVHHVSVTLSAATPAYFRGFTLIALKEGKEGDKEEDHAGSFQVRELSLTYTLKENLGVFLTACLAQREILHAQQNADHV